MFGYEGLIRKRWTHVAGSLLARPEFYRFRGQVFIGNHAQQVLDAVEAGMFLDVRVDHVPGRLLDIGMCEIIILGLRILEPEVARLDIHGAQFPALGRILDAALNLFDGTGALIDSLQFTSDAFTQTPLGFDLDVPSLGGLGIYTGDQTTAILEVSFDADGDGQQDELVTVSVDLFGVMPGSLDL